MAWNPTAYSFLIENQYEQIINIYEQAIIEDPETHSNYWYLGLAQLLHDAEEEAQLTWLYALSMIEEGTSDLRTTELIEVLEAEALRQQEINQFETAWLIRLHIRQIYPELLCNLLDLINFSIQTNKFTPQLLSDWEVADYLNHDDSDVNPNRVLDTLKQLFDFPSPQVFECVKSALRYANSSRNWIEPLLKFAVHIGEDYNQPLEAAQITERLLNLDSHNINILKYLSRFCLNAKQYKRAIDVSRKFFLQSQTLSQRFISNFQLLKALTYAGSWLEIDPIAQQHKLLLKEIFQHNILESDLELKTLLASSTGFLAYIQDDVAENRFFHNQAGVLFQKSQSSMILRPETSEVRSYDNKIKIGYIANTFRQHSVGWLSRWLFQYHNHENFHITIYLVNISLEDSFYQAWFEPYIDRVRSCGLDAQNIAEQISKDQIDILVDLDSLTFNVTYEVMSLKPAPIQVTWLGWDASGLPSIDYFLADPYVLTSQAQNFYLEKIWRLPDTYIAVDGFEVGIPTLRRSDLAIPTDAIVFLSSQSGAKRHPETASLQMRIIKQVPNSYLLIKTVGEADIIRDFFLHIAQQEGVEAERLKFFPWAADEYTHRANLLIADVVLDTYPYNGATTTLEALWMEIPLVTKVGEIFSSRNSYAFMMNAGLKEGISWSDAEYVDWGVKFGLNEALRNEVCWKLAKSKNRSPLWNSQQFTIELEKAYRQMWTCRVAPLK